MTLQILLPLLSKGFPTTASDKTLSRLVRNLTTFNYLKTLESAVHSNGGIVYAEIIPHNGLCLIPLYYMENTWRCQVAPQASS